MRSLVAMETALIIGTWDQNPGLTEVPTRVTRPSRVQALRRGYCHDLAQTPCPTRPRPLSEPPSPSSHDLNVPVGFRPSPEPPFTFHPTFTPMGPSAGPQTVPMSPLCLRLWCWLPDSSLLSHPVTILVPAFHSLATCFTLAFLFMLAPSVSLSLLILVVA